MTILLILQALHFKKCFLLLPEKVWGVSKKKIDANWATKRVEIREKSRPFYSNQFAAVGIEGSGTIIRALEKKAKSLGVRFKLNESINKLIIDKNHNTKEVITSKRKIRINSSDLIINTTSITNISKQLDIKTTLQFRGIKLIYLFLKNKKIFPKKTDFVYFDDPNLVFNRISDQNSFIKTPMKSQTIFCCEVTYSKKDSIDRMSNKNLEKKVINDFYKLPFVRRKCYKIVFNIIARSISNVFSRLSKRAS